MNKKAQISKALSDFVGYGVFVIVFLVFLLLFNMSATINKVKTPRVNELTGFSFNNVESNHILLNFLRTDVYDNNLPQKTVKMSDYLVLAAYAESDKNYPEIKKQLDAYTKNFKGCYELTVSKEKSSVLYLSNSPSGSCSAGDDLSKYELVSIPTKNNEILDVKFRMYVP